MINGMIKTNSGQRQVKLSYICRSCGEVIKNEWREFGPEFIFGDMCPGCKKAEAEDANIKH